MKIPFSPPDISERDIANVVDALRSGWITTGPKTKQLEKDLSVYCGTAHTACLNSANAALELSLRVLGIGPGDEVITSAYTYTASCSVICHVGATPVLIDVDEGSYHMSAANLEKAITPKTKAVIPVDIGGVPADYDAIFSVLEGKKDLFTPASDLQRAIGRVAVVADAAHSVGATYKGRQIGSVADFTCFSFHAVKNLTTAEGGSATWLDFPGIDGEEIYRQFMLPLSLIHIWWGKRCARPPSSAPLSRRAGCAIIPSYPPLAPWAERGQGGIAKWWKTALLKTAFSRGCGWRGRPLRGAPLPTAPFATAPPKTAGCWAAPSPAAGSRGAG